MKVIRSEADYQEALHRAEALWGAAADTAEGDELDILVPLIEAHEREHHSIDLPAPSENS